MKLTAFILFLFPLCLFAQTKDTAKSILNSKTYTIKDSTLLKDSTSTAKDSVKKKSDVDTIVYAQAQDSIIFVIDKKRMLIYGKGEVQYKETDLKSANIDVDFNTNFINAKGIPNDSLPGKFKDTPVLTDKGEPYEGKTMRYNFKTLQGYITTAQTETEGTYYTGDKIKKVSKDVYFIKDGVYTTCDLDTPHYNFYASEMKVIHKQQLVARWIWLYIGGVPLPIPIPFAVFPIESGRRSGILVPAFGESRAYGRYFSRFGYFWAINDFMDATLTSDFYTRGSYNVKGRYRYAKRYNYVGELNLGLSEFKSGIFNENRNEAWNIIWNHNQTIDPTSRLDANLEFTSGKNYNTQTSTNINQLLDQDITSNATYSKSFEDIGSSLSINYSRHQNLNTGNVSEDLPNISFNKYQFYPFQRKNSVGTKLWYEQIGLNYNGTLSNQRSKSNGHLDVKSGADHNIGLNLSQKFGYFNITPSMQYEEKWYLKHKEYENSISPFSQKDTVTSKDVHQLSMVRTFSLNLSATTKFYGMFQPNAFGLSAIRHTVIPSVGYSFRPDFSKSFWGYYGTYKDSLGHSIKYDKYADTRFGGASQGEYQSLNFSLSNVFEGKTKVDPSDTTGKENKIQLLNVDMNASYNFTADSVKLSRMNLNFRTNLGEYLNLNGGSTFSFYDYDQYGNDINQFLINNKKGFMRLTSFNFNISTSISGEKLKSKTPQTQKETSSPEEGYITGQNKINYRGIYEEKEADFSIPWSMSLNYYFVLSRPKPGIKNITANSISANIDFNLTKNWKFAIQGNYDFIRKEVAAPYVTVSRDLHCWLMNFYWTPLGNYRGYRFEIKVKAPQLQDLKLTKQDYIYR